MAKLKTFKRDDVLEAAIKVFWRKGFADTSIHDLERATSLKKSSLYAEFQNKEDLFLCSLDHYSKTTYGAGILNLRPLGWHNIERLLRIRVEPENGETGCFVIYSMREYSTLSSKIQRHLEERVAQIRDGFLKNIAAEHTNLDPEKVTDIFMSLFVGLAFNDNFRMIGIDANHPIDEIMAVVKSL
ncbi:MAG TPA: TetR/AcrR family transcriptional regulator [Oculatellaceae cyanobacterium]